ncbi:MAG: translocation/assembly module TamB domain-containing protein, partial [Leptolyngbyaceae bacterium]|nr:translocation/assembly module TamB domain-containing protein [Leptolyngbyaceae bacterium]
KLRVKEATARNFNADGVIFARTEGAGAPAITGLDLNVQARDYALNTLPLNLPKQVVLAGQADFTGKLTGTLTAPKATGDLQLYDLSVNNVAFEPVLRGNLKFTAGQGVDLQVAGQQDQIEIALNQNYRPESFLVERDQAIATGQTIGERLLVDIRNFPIALLNVSPVPVLGPIKGNLTGKFDLNVQRFTGSGEVAIANPVIGSFAADLLQGRVSYANGVATLAGAELRQAESIYQASGTLIQGDNPQFQGQVKVTQGNLQDLTQALQWFELGDILRGIRPPTYNTAADLQPASVGLPKANLLTQLRRFSEIQALLEQQVAQREQAPLPPLADLQGAFSGELKLSGSLKSGLSANFNFQGRDWKWGRYVADQVVLNGNFEDGSLTLLPFRFQSGDTRLSFSGQVGGASQTGQLRVENLPLESLQTFVELPLDITGKVNGTATLSGSFLNPQILGELSLAEGTLNRTPITTARGRFNYREARLGFSSTIAVTGPEPIEMTGSLPLELPFTLAVPESDQISLNVRVQNEGLALLNLLNRQVTWVNGKGQVRLQVEGTLEKPIATGTATIENAIFRVQALPEPLTQVTGNIRFDRDRILVENLQGQFSQGQVTAQGILPIFARLPAEEADPANLLTVSLNRIAINLKGLYRGGVDGKVLVTGTARAPELGGEIQLSNGQVLLPDQSKPSGTPATQAVQLDKELFSPPELKNLRLTLGDRVLITRQPILSFLASGDLNLNGTLDRIRPQGEIRLRAGQVNLYTTEFTLAGGYEHKARFLPNQGLDPTLDLRLITSVPEVTRSPITSPSLFDGAPGAVEDLPASNLGALQTVRIQARVSGPASQLFDNLELTSSPTRSSSEIIALLGGGFVNTLGRGDSQLALANLAGSAILTQVQGLIGNALGLSEFRLFPTVITSNEARTAATTSSFGLAAELGVEITRDLSASILRILTVDQPAQFGLRYRLNDQLLLRTSTDFSGDTKANLEYEIRF